MATGKKLKYNSNNSKTFAKNSALNPRKKPENY